MVLITPLDGSYQWAEPSGAAVDRKVKNIKAPNQVLCTSKSTGERRC